MDPKPAKVVEDTHQKEQEQGTDTPGSLNFIFSNTQFILEIVKLS